MGGADQHMMHPHDDLTLRFSDILSMIAGHAMGSIPVTEKFDGINLNFTKCSKSTGFARNIGDVRKGGSDLKAFEKWLGNHPGKPQFLTGAKAIENTEICWQLPNDHWVSTEVLSSEYPQLLRYDCDYLIFHGVSVLSENKKAMTNVTDRFSNSYNSLINESKSEWRILGQSPIKMTDRSQESFYINALQELTALMKFWKMEWWNTLEDLVVAKTKKRIDWWGLTDSQASEFINMILGYGGSVVKFRKLLPVSYHDDLNSIGMHKTRDRWTRQCVNDIKALWVRFGAALLAPMNSQLISNKLAQESRLKALLYYSVNEVEARRDDGEHCKAVYNRFRGYLQDYKSLAVSPPTIEGLVFYHRGHRYKLTGAFASLNRVIGTARYDLGLPMPENL